MKKFFALSAAMMCFNSTALANATNSKQETVSLDTLWVLIAAALVFLMQAGFKSLEVGLVRKNHSSTVAMKNIIDWSIGSLIFFLFGFGLMFGKSASGFIGISMLFPTAFDVEGGNELGTVFFMFQLAFVGTALTIVSGAMSERTGFLPYIVATIFISIVIYPVFGHWVWGGAFFEGNSGWLESLGFKDFAGSTVVHSVGAWVSLAGLIHLGPRMGRFGADGKPKEMKPYSMAYATLGVFLLWFGWWGFNGGSTLAFSKQVGVIVLNTNIAGAAAALSAYFHALFFQQKKSIYEKLIGGALGGLVAITASANLQNPLTSLAIGFVAGIVHNIGYEWLLKKRIDDAVGAIPIHGFCGVLGTLLVVVSPTYINSGFSEIFKQLSIQLVGIVVCFVWTFGLGYALFAILKKVVGLRVTPNEEREGILLYPIKHKKEEKVDDVELEELLGSM